MGSQSLPLMKIYAVRHGETDENSKHIIQGQLDTKLNAAGVHQAQIVAKALKDIPFVEAWSSDLERAAETGKAILKHHPDLQLSLSREVRERHMGKFQGLKWSKEARAKFSDTFEPEDVFAERILTWWDTMVQHHTTHLAVSPPPDTEKAILHVLVVSHGAWIATLVRRLVLRDTTDAGRAEVAGTIGTCNNASITTIDVFRDGRAKLVRYSDISHMSPGTVLMPNVDDQQIAASIVGVDGSIAKEIKSA